MADGERALGEVRRALVKRSLVTGGHGFIGSHLARGLLERGDSVTVLDVAPTESSALALHGVAAEVEVFTGSIEDATLVGGILTTDQYDTVFHLAAQTLVGPAQRTPAATFETNVRGTWTLLEACRAAEIPAVVVASSDKAYGPSEELPYREESELRPASPYEASKAAADVLARSYWRSHRLPVAVTRLANVYGGADLNFSRIVPEAVTAALDGRSPVIRSDGSPERDYLYVADAVSAYLAVESAVGAGGPAAGEAMNAGTGEAHSVRDVLELVAEAADTDLTPEWQGSGTPPGEIDRQFVDARKLKTMTGWRPGVAIEEGIAKTVAWYREHPEVRPA